MSRCQINLETVNISKHAKKRLKERCGITDAKGKYTLVKTIMSKGIWEVKNVAHRRKKGLPKMYSVYYRDYELVLLGNFVATIKVQKGGAI